MRKELFFLFLLWCVTLYAQTLQEIEKKPTSRARDLLVWEFLLQKRISQEDARKAYELVANKNNLRIQKAYVKHVDDDIAYRLRCKKEKSLPNIQDDRCLALAFSLSKSASLSKFERDKLRTRNVPQSMKTLLRLQNETPSFANYRKYAPQTLITFFMQQPLSFWQKKLEPIMNEEFISFLQNAPNFKSFVSFGVTSYSLPKLHKALLHAKQEGIASSTAFYLALNALRLDQKSKAKSFLQSSYKHAQFTLQKDKIDFWLYLVTKKRSYLQNLLLSMDINIYTLYAHEKLHVDVENYFTEILSDQSKKATTKLQDPFVWLEILQKVKQTPQKELFSLAKSYRQKGMEPAARYILERAYNFTMHGYLRLYDEYMNEIGAKKHKAMMNALMRRESGYVPSALSRSFALGLMQLMPFLVDHLAQKNGTKLKSYTQMFEPRRNILYAWQHLRWLEKSLHENPLFIAYAYNGGYGFFTRYKKSGRFAQGDYEPFLSMEMMRNSETREYGKYVLANFVIYKKLYNEPFSLIEFFQKLR